MNDDFRLAEEKYDLGMAVRRQLFLEITDCMKCIEKREHDGLSEIMLRIDVLHKLIEVLKN